MVRIVKSDQFHDNSELQKADLKILEIVEGIDYTYKLLDIIDNELVAKTLFPNYMQHRHPSV